MNKPKTRRAIVLTHSGVMGCRDDILATIRTLVVDRPDGVFSPREVMSVMRAQRSPYGSATIESFITSIMCVDAPPSRRCMYPDLERVSRGRYRLRSDLPSHP